MKEEVEETKKVAKEEAVKDEVVETKKTGKAEGKKGEVGAKAAEAIPEKDPFPEKEEDQKEPGKSFFRDDTYKVDSPPTHWKTKEADIPYGPYTRKEKTKHFIHP